MCMDLSLEMIYMMMIIIVINRGEELEMHLKVFVTSEHKFRAVCSDCYIKKMLYQMAGLTSPSPGGKGHVCV